MTRYIDADAVISGVKNRCIGQNDVVKVEHSIISMIYMMPTIDAVPVIRCKDCKHRDPEDKKCDCGHSIRWQLPRSDEWFCADAERRGEGWKK